MPGDVTNRFLRDSRASRDRKRIGLKGYGGPYPDRTQGQIPDGVWVWMNDVEEWGRDVRQDILDLEKVLSPAQKKQLKGLKAGRGGKKGDPGDPPPPPPDDNE